MPTLPENIAFCDAHLDQFGPQSGGWGSAEQLMGMEHLSGALRVLFCEREGDFPRSPAHWVEEADHIRTQLHPRYMPQHWRLGAEFRLHVEGLEAGRDELEYVTLLDQCDRWGVLGCNPIYHKSNPLGGCSKESGLGLTTLGQRFVRRAAWRGWWMDLAHMSARSAEETLVIHEKLVSQTSGTCCYTHGGIQHLEITNPLITQGNLERCLSVGLALKLAELGGLVCLSPARPFYERLDGPFLEHLHLLGQATQWRRVGIGTDYGGILDEWRLPGCATVADCFRTVALFLLEAGLEEWQVRNVMGLNVQSFFRLNP